MKIKICGLREYGNVEDLVNLKPDWMGFIFTEKSPRYFYNALEKADLNRISSTIKKVGVFVNASLDYIQEQIVNHQLNTVQLHGNESPEVCATIRLQGIEIFKAFNINDEFEFEKLDAYKDAIDYYLFDASGKSEGGNGVTFNWNILNDKRFLKPFLLSGGIAPEHAAQLKKWTHPDCIGIDINSKFEIEPAFKNVALIKTFFKNLDR